MNIEIREPGRLLSEPAPGATPAESSAETVTVVEPPQGWQLINLGEMWRFRELIYFLAWRDVKVRYKQTILGAAWAVLQPAMMMVVLSIIFQRMVEVSSGDLPYPLFAFAGLLPWSFFASAINNAASSVIGAERLVTKIYFPRLAIPLASVVAALVDFLIAMGLLVFLMIYYHDSVTLSPALLLAPVIFALIFLAAIGTGTLLAALNVTYRDFRYVIPFLIQIWMFATPVIYMVTDPEPSMGRPPVRGASANNAGAVRQLEGPQGDPSGAAGQKNQAGGGKADQPRFSAFQVLTSLNPMTGLIGAFRAAILGGSIPWNQLMFSSIYVALILLLGCFYFRKVEDSFADII